MFLQKGLLLLNLGSPSNTSLLVIWRYLSEFLNDKRVIEIPQPLRWLLVNTLIIPLRIKNTQKAYQSIWTENGSPLIEHHRRLIAILESIAPEYKIALGMRYGEPSITQALETLADCHEITILPLYPQYASASTGSVIEETLKQIKRHKVIPKLHIIPHFYQHPAYIEAQAMHISAHMPTSEHNHLVFCYHSLPETHLRHHGCQKPCQEICPTNRSCYRAQCFATSASLAKTLSLSQSSYSTAFQSRLGKTPWIKPYFTDLLPQLIQQGIENVTIVSPSFVADCLETLEELGMRGQEMWHSLGGKHFRLIPAMNANPIWGEALRKIVETPLY